MSIHEFWLLHEDAVILSGVCGSIGGIFFAIGHEIIKAATKSLKGESWYAFDSTLDRLARKMKK